MRLACALLSLLVATAVAGSTLHADQFPYRAYISGSGVYVRSGPGKDYYPTHKLQRGEFVEVYRHDPGGWYAVRPPKGSFSWVAARHLKVRKGNLAEVIGDRVVAYVGSRFSDVHDVRQVHLDRGEFVEVIGEKRFVRPKEGIAETWYKVAPPSGEFRWVYGRYVIQRGIPDTVARRDGFAVSAPEDGESYDDHGHYDQRHGHSRVDDEYVETGEEDADLDGGGGEQMRIATAAYDGGDDVDEYADGHRHPEVGDHGHSSSVRGAGHRESARGESRDGRVWGPSGRRLDLELSMIVAEPAETWDLTDIHARTEDAVRQAPTALDRGRARALLGEITRFEAMKQQYLADEQQHALPAAAVDTGQVATTPTGPELVSPQAERAAVVLGTEPSPADFDGIGRLTPVVSRKIGAPKFALTDMKGNVLMFVTPSLGVDLQPFVGRVVGLSGARGFMPALKKTHLAASQVEQLAPTALVAARRSPRWPAAN